jgi:hypothetical protein
MVALLRCVRFAINLRLLGSRHVTANLLASAFGDILPFALIVIGFALCSARMGAIHTSTVVLPGFRDPKTFFFARIGSVRGSDCSNTQSGESGGQQGLTFIHGKTPENSSN